MKIFLSWSGDRSRLLAGILRDQIPLILHYVKPWMSDIDIAAGKRWATEVGTSLEDAEFGILCLTKENYQAPWVLFEAGALGKFIGDSIVCPYLLDLDYRDLSGPLSQFQAKRAEKESTYEVLSSINKHAPASIPEGRLQELFELVWPRIESEIRTIPEAAPKKPSSRPVEDVLEDLVATVRETSARLQSLELRVEERQPQRDASETGRPEHGKVIELYPEQRLGLVKPDSGGEVVMFSERDLTSGLQFDDLKQGHHLKFRAFWGNRGGIARDVKRFFPRPKRITTPRRPQVEPTKTSPKA